ncbi:internalin, partial [Bacillus toyonensis]|uniref:LPXTG cell wall anchor domain-containing protein n=1 Tax=Bacillus toyonensis TaxID=155322 RepID=UPI000BEE3450
PVKEVEETKEEVKEPVKEVEETKEEVKEPIKEVEETKEEVKEPVKEVEGTKEEVKEPVKEVEGTKEEVKESTTGLNQEPKGDNQVGPVKVVGQESTQQVNKQEENQKSLAATGSQANTSSLLSGLAFVLSALSMFVFRKRVFKK